MFWERKKTKIVYFDVGGVLVDADLERYVQICCAMFRTTPEPLKREIGLRVPALECGSISSADFWREVGESLWRNGEGSLADDSDFCNLWRDLMASSLIINSEVIKICQSLAQNNMRIGILSNAIAEHAGLLRFRGVYSPFAPCIISCEVGMRKPDDEIYQLAAKEAKVKTSECLFIDDVEYNVEAARKNGMDAILFTDAPALAAELMRRELLPN